MGESQEGVQCLGKALLHNQGRKCIPAYVRRILQSNCALDTNVWKQDMELVTKEFEMSQRVSSTGAWCMAGKRSMKLQDGTWKYPNLTAVLDKVGLKTIAPYIGMQRQHIASYIVDKPIFRTCLNGLRRRGSNVRLFWWAQPMDLETAQVARLVGPVVVSDDEGD